MVIGVLIGRFIPIVPNALGKLEFYNVSIPTTILLWIMIYPMMLKIDFKSIKNPKGLFITWFVNWIIKPFTMYLICPPFSWTDIIKLLFGNEFGILPDSFLLI